MLFVVLLSVPLFDRKEQKRSTKVAMTTFLGIRRKECQISKNLVPMRIDSITPNEKFGAPDESNESIGDLVTCDS